MTPATLTTEQKGHVYLWEEKVTSNFSRFAGVIVWIASVNFRGRRIRCSTASVNFQRKRIRSRTGSVNFSGKRIRARTDVPFSSPELDRWARARRKEQGLAQRAILL